MNADLLASVAALNRHVGERLVDAMRVRHVEGEILGVAKGTDVPGILLSEVPVHVEDVEPFRHDQYYIIITCPSSWTSCPSYPCFSSYPSWPS